LIGLVLFLLVVVITKYILINFRTKTILNTKFYMIYVRSSVEKAAIRKCFCLTWLD
jgi:hypothetical protein